MDEEKWARARARAQTPRRTVFIEYVCVVGEVVEVVVEVVSSKDWVAEVAEWAGG